MDAEAFRVSLSAIGPSAKVNGVATQLNGKMNDYNAFIQANTNVVKVYVPKSVRLNGGSVLAPYQITRGSLPSVAMTKNAQSILVSDINLGSLVIDAETTVADLANAVIAYNEGGGSETVTVAAPTFSGDTQFTESTQVTMSGPAGASIFYTVDGSTPTDQSLEYEEPITLSETTIIKAIAIKDGVSSSVTSRTYSKVEAGGGDEDEPGGDDH